MVISKCREWLYVLCYADSSINEIALTEEDEDVDIETILGRYGLNADECSWMFTTNRIENITNLNIEKL